MRILFHISAIFYLPVALVSATLVNITVDDTAPYPADVTLTYAPSADDVWELSPSCDGCSPLPDPQQAKDGTWHTATEGATLDTAPQNVTFEFTGSALYVYGIISQSDKVYYSFFLDGASTGSPFIRDELSSGPVIYNQILYSNPSMPNGSHTFVLQNGQPRIEFSLLLLDYIIYTTDDGNELSSNISTTDPSSTMQMPSSSTAGADTTSSTITSSNKPAPARNLHSSPSHGLSTHLRSLIISLAIIAFCILLACLGFLCRRRRRRRRRAAAKVDLSPFDNDHFAGDRWKQQWGNQHGNIVAERTANSYSVAAQSEETTGSFRLLDLSTEEAFSLGNRTTRSRPRSSLAVSQLDAGQSLQNISDISDGLDTVFEQGGASTPLSIATIPPSREASHSPLLPSPRHSIASTPDGLYFDEVSRRYTASIPPSYTSRTTSSPQDTASYTGTHTRSSSAADSTVSSSSPTHPPSYTSNSRSDPNHCLGRMRSFRSVGWGSTWSHDGFPPIPSTPLPGYYSTEDHSRS